MPLAADMPAIENVLVQVPTDEGPFGARAVAEPPGFGPPAAIANAIEDAVGIRLKELPLSAEKLLRALRGESLEEVQLDLALLRQLRGAGGPIQWATAGEGPALLWAASLAHAMRAFRQAGEARSSRWGGPRRRR